MENKELIRLLSKLQVLCVRYVERHTSLRCVSYRDIDRIITKNKLTCTYAEAIENLYNNISKYCRENSYLMEQILNLKEAFDLSEILNLRFGVEPQRKFNALEKDLDIYREKQIFFYIGEMNSIKDTCAVLGLNEETIKKACQEERLLNTKKVGNGWQVNLRECMQYWSKTLKEDGLYKDWVY